MTKANGGAFKRDELLSVLKRVKGAVDSSGIYSIFGHFCFNGTYVYSFNDVCAVITPLNSGLKIGIHGDALLGVLPTLKENLNLALEDQKAILTSDRARIELTTMPASSFMFDQPKEKEWVAVFVGEEFFDGLQRCIQTVGDPLMQREFTGVAFKLSKNCVNVYSSDDIRLSKLAVHPVRIDPKAPETNEWLLPAQACTLFVEAWQNLKTMDLTDADDSDEPRICFGKKWAYLHTPYIKVYAKLMQESPPDFEATIKKVAPINSLWQPIPDEFKQMVRRAEVLADKDPGAAIKLVMSRKTIKASLTEGTGATLGGFDEQIAIESAVENLALSIGPGKLATVVEGASEMSFNPLCLGLRSTYYHCWIAPLSTRE